jgi:hypothetical protein
MIRNHFWGIVISYFMIFTFTGCNHTQSNDTIEDKVGLTLIGNDQNNFKNTTIQPTQVELAGGGRNQSLNFADILIGDTGDDILIGNLGRDVLLGNDGNDIIVGGTEDFNSENRDFALGGAGDDVFIWSPGDGSDFFDGGEGNSDVLIFGIVGEGTGNTANFNVENDENADGVFLDPQSGLPVVDVANSPGFCEILSDDYSTDIKALDLDHLVRFSIRRIADEFEMNGGDDNGLRITVHARNVEYVVCTNRAGGEVEVIDISMGSPVVTDISNLPARAQALLRTE